MPKIIDEFDGEFNWLSNFFMSNVTIDGIMFHHNEGAFQASKTLDKKEKFQFVLLTPGQSKRLGRKVKLRSDWEKVKIEVMLHCVRQKFIQNPELKARLIATGDAILIEGNWWNDTFWGVCNGIGQNNLGKILMQVRKELSE